MKWFFSAALMAGIEVDQRIARLSPFALLDIDGADDPCFERLNGFGAAVGMILPGATATISTLPRHAHATASVKKAMTDQMMALPKGDGGVSVISSAAGRKASSALVRLAGFRGMTLSAGFIKPRLYPVQRRVAAAGLDELVVGAVFDEASLVDSEDAVRAPAPWKACAL